VIAFSPARLILSILRTAASSKLSASTWTLSG
jgi:hypothetical protein